MSESTDNPTLDVEALAELIAAADLTLPIKMEYRFSAELMCDVGTMIVGDGVEARIHTVQTALLIEAALNQLPALLAKLDEIDRARDTAEFEADQLRMERDEAVELLRTVWEGVVNSRHREQINRLLATSAAAPKATCLCEWTQWAEGLATVRQIAAVNQRCPEHGRKPCPVAVPDAGSGETTDGEVGRD